VEKGVMYKKVLLFCVILFGQPSWAQEDLSVLSGLLGKLDGASMVFVQHTFDGSGALLQSQKGKIYLAQPDKFRWESEEPYSQLLVSDGVNLWQYDEDLEQVTTQKLDKRLSATPALLLSGDVGPLQSEYDIFSELLQDEKHFVLIPKRADALFDRLRLEFVGNELSRMIIKDEVGQKTVLSFKQHSRYLKNDSLFTFSAPEGVDVISAQ